MTEKILLIQQKELEDLWGKVGYIVHLSQMIEYSLANILAFSELFKAFENSDTIKLDIYNKFAKCANKWYRKLETKTFGYALQRAREISFFTTETQNRFKHICEERNFVVHRLFRDDLKLKYLENEPSYYYERLENLIEEMYIANEELNIIFNKQKEEYKLIF